MESAGIPNVAKHTLKRNKKTFFTTFIDWFSHMSISDVNEHICRVSETLVTFETLAGRGILESLQLFRICVEHQSLPLFAHLNKIYLRWVALGLAKNWFQIGTNFLEPPIGTCLGENEHRHDDM